MAASRRESEYVEYITAKIPWLRRTAYLLCQDVHRVDDLVQSTITKLYINWPRVAKVEHPDAYARMVLVNQYLSEQRTNWWRRVTTRSEPVDAEDPGTAGPSTDLDLRLDLSAALAGVPPRQRATLVLRFYCDLSVEETARVMNCSVGNVKSQTSRGLATLRTALTADLADLADREESDHGIAR
ncbi:MAG TPA: SigE family RNA polymerase sigma factor [Actinocrinis sp.]|nr:SigE family RNA polymerase sigma factor [Actinocrinis sp.]